MTQQPFTPVLGFLGEIWSTGTMWLAARRSLADHKMRNKNPIGYWEMVAGDPNEPKRLNAVQKLANIASGKTMPEEDPFEMEGRERAWLALVELAKTSPYWDVKELATRLLNKQKSHQLTFAR
jgi:hypothetical protein